MKKILIIFIFITLILPVFPKDVEGYAVSQPAYEFIFEEIDQYAINTPDSKEAMLEILVPYLIATTSNELEKARVIYRWITDNIAYDADGYFSGNYKSTNAEDVLLNRSCVCQGYANLFSKMAELAGLEAVIITGFAKGYDYFWTSNFPDDRHAWNAIKINGIWHLLDATWGAGYIDGVNGDFVKHYKDFYFLTPPEEFIFDHLPQDPVWQLLDETITIEKFKSMVELYPVFFNSGLSHEEAIQRTLYTYDSKIVLRLRTKYDVIINANLVHVGYRMGLGREQIIISDLGDGYFEIEINLEITGEFLLQVFVSQEYDLAMTYLVVFK